MMLECYHQYQISLNLKKCVFCAPFGAMLGHVVCCERILINPTEIVIILDLPPPTTFKQLRATLGNIEYYRKFIKGYVEATDSMEKLLKKDTKFQWTEDCQEILDKLKNNMATLSILAFPY